MPTFSDNSDWLAEVNGEPLELPLRGRVFRFSGSPTIAQGVRLKQIQTDMREAMARHLRGEVGADAVAVPDDQQFYDELLGDQLAAMTEAGCTDAEKNHVAVTVLVYYLQGAQMAELHWTGKLHKTAEDIASGEAKPTGTTKTATPKAKAQPSRGGTPTTRRSPSSKRTSRPTTASNS